MLIDSLVKNKIKIESRLHCLDIHDADCICQLLNQKNLENYIFDCLRLNKITACQVNRVMSYSQRYPLHLYLIKMCII